VGDFSFRRGRSWGTILVDILPDRRSETFAELLAHHSGVEVIMRVRGCEYAETIKRNMPRTIQTAGRSHLLKNLGDVVLRVF
jgi:transposase